MYRWIVKTEEPNSVEITFPSFEEAEEFVQRCMEYNIYNKRVLTIRKYKQVSNGNFSDE